jgi:hypothetical protein
MSGKNQFPFQLNWQTTSPLTGFLPQPQLYAGGSKPSGLLVGAMASTNVIYSNIIEISRVDNGGLELNFNIVGGDAATGVLGVWCSISGKFSFALTFNPALSQPAGSALTYGINLNQIPYKYMYLVYTNTSGSGSMSAYGQYKDLN